MRVLVTGAQGFVGRNLCAVLQPETDLTVTAYDIDSQPAVLEEALATADVVVHLAGVNRPQNVEEFATGNAGFTRELLDRLRAVGRTPKFLLSSSIHAAGDTPYGLSKREAEAALQEFCAETGACGVIYRLKNLFGKWCRPNYNSVTATFCHNIARGLPIQISDPANEVDLTYVDDVTAALRAEIVAPATPGCRWADPLPSRRITLGDLAALIRSFHAHRETLQLADYSDPFVRALYATYLSYLDTDQFAYALPVHTDDRGSLAEFLKSPHIGQLFISRTRPGITRGNHYHHTKTEKFMVVQGEGLIRFRRLGSDEILEYRVRGEEYRVVDIPPGYTHSIENTGDTEMVTLFWSSQVFDPDHPDTYAAPVLPA